MTTLAEQQLDVLPLPERDRAFEVWDIRALAGGDPEGLRGLGGQERVTLLVDAFEGEEIERAEVRSDLGGGGEAGEGRR